MKTIAILSAAAALATTMALPAMAGDMNKDGAKGAMRTHAMHQNRMGQRAMGQRSMQRDARMQGGAMQQRDANGGWNNNGWDNARRDDGNWDRDDSGFWPADVAAGAVGVAAGVAGAAVNTAGAIATAPFQDTYAYDNRGDADDYGNVNYQYGQNGYYGDWNSYAARNGLVCQPGTWFKGPDGRRQICQ